MKLKLWLKGLLLILLVGVIIIQFFQIKPNSVEVSGASDFMEMTNPPPDIKRILVSSCYDCHSNKTAYPWYSKVQPVGWLLQDHIEKGRTELNFSEYGNYSERRRRMKLKSSISQIEDGEMPLASYTMLHSEARLSKEEKRSLLDFMEKLHDSL